MSVLIRAGLALAVLAGGALTLRAQGITGDRPQPAQPRTPQTRAELDRREALKLYALGMALERGSLLLEAARTYERALDLDPDSNALRKALAPLYLALDRTDDALDVCREVVDRDPGDYETWYLLARQYRVLDRPRDAAAALARAAECAGLKEQPELRVQIAFDLAAVQETLQEFAEAEVAFAAVTSLLENPEPLLELGVFTREDVAAQAAEAYERMGKVAAKAGHVDKAIAAYRKAQEKDPRRQLRLDYNLADIYLAQGQLDQALASLDNYLRTQPVGIEPYELKITLLTRLGRAQQVIPSLKAHAQADAENVELKLLLARECGKAGLSRDAETIYLGLLEKTARADVYRGLFEMMKRQGIQGGMLILAHLNQAVQGSSENPNQPPNPADAAVAAARARAMLLVLRDDADLVKLLLPAAKPQLAPRWGDPGLHAETRRLLAVLATRTKQLEEAEALYRSCLLQGGFGRRGEGELYNGLLRVLYQARKYEEIVQVCKEGLTKAQATNRLLFHDYLSQTLVILDRFDEALDQADQALAIAGDDDKLRAQRSRISVLAQSGKIDQAETEALALFKDFKDPDDVREIRYTLSQVYSLAKKPTKAEEQLELILKEHPDDATAHNDLGYTWADQNKNLDEAEKLIRRALELDRKQRSTGPKVDPDSDRDNAAYIDSLGWVLFRRGRLAEAKAELEKAAKLPGGDDDPVVWDHLGDVNYRLGEAGPAKAAWVRALELAETAKRRKADDRVRDLQAKIKLLEQTPKPR